jgi:phage portal protein BeeE
MTKQNQNTTPANEYGKAYAKAEALQAQNDQDILAILGGLDFAAYSVWRDEFKAGAKAAGYAAPDMLWSRLTKRLGEFYGFAPPKSAKVESQQKAEKREKEKATMQDIKAQCAGKSEQDILTEAAEAIMQGEASRAKLLTSAALSLAKDAEKASKDAERAELAAARDAIIAKVRAYHKAGNILKLNEILNSCGNVAEKKTKIRKAA